MVHAEEAALRRRIADSEEFLLVGGDEFVGGGAGKDGGGLSEYVRHENLGGVFLGSVIDEALGGFVEEFEGFADYGPSGTAWWEVFGGAATISAIEQKICRCGRDDHEK